MILFLTAGGIAVITLTLLWRARTRRGRAHLYNPPHTPPTVPWTPHERHGADTTAAESRSDRA